MQGVRDSASKVAASAKSELEKARAIAQEKAEKMKTRDPVEKEMAVERKEERMTQAELDKQAAAARHTGTHGASDYTTGEPGYTAGHAARTETGGVVGSQDPPGEYTGSERVPIRDSRTGVGHPDQLGGTGGAY